ncbi:MAG: hypothetical protein J6J44_00030 [Lachnospiraceae bacterium]|nr:hypothetical protein [Lachnospiraceae bacterium]
MKRKEVIVDADFCIKIGSSSKYRYLEKLLPELAEVVYIHKTVYEEILYPSCVREQIDSLKKQGIMVLMDENELLPLEKRIYDSTYQILSKAMADPRNRRKNRGEIASLAMAKTKEIPYFATDEMDLQNIVDSLLNSGIGKRICCIRIEAVIKEMKDGEIDSFKRKEAKVLWVLAGKRKEDFDNTVWPVEK